ncbi:MAG: hypothetical protein CMF56_02185 [Leifsonia sp.]|uniref:nuclease-related domain-containing protein n=1 Tax=Microbacterium sp. UBA1612 TaxID=1946942 RepID=UPI000C55C5BC|nr:nuclease-related domain-containing protein [Microbacterium sp. UBA1612]MAT17361.1 hypothetical protein [Leifsonia sp.]HBS73440.1 hypothetical protein [Microbacterium sp.]
MSDLRERVPGHSLMDELLRQWDRGTIRVDEGGTVVIDDEARGWFDGVTGERRVAEILATLGPEWTVLHSVPVGSRGTDIDHIAISTAGVFAINTKYSPGRKVWAAGRGLHVDGFKQPYIFASIRESKRVEEALSRASGLAIDVVSLIVFVAPSQITRKAPSGDGVTLIQVISDRELVRTLRRRPVYSEEQIGRIVDAAVRPETWMTKPRPSSPPDHVRREYDALAAAVGPRRPAKPEPKRVNVPARPRPRPSLGARIASALAEPPSPSARRPAPRRRNQRRRKSFAERLITDLAGPIVGLVVLWGVYNSLLSR